MIACHTFSIELTLRSPFLFRGLAQGASGLDTAQIRDEQGRPFIPADQIRGVVREALYDLAAVGALSMEQIMRWFGAPSSTREGRSGETDRPDRGHLIFGDLVAETMQAREGAEALPLSLVAAADITRIMIDDETGTASRGALQVIELVAPFGALVRFAGPLVAFGPAEEAARFVRTLKQALALLSSIGALKSAGFGEVVTTQVKVVGTPTGLSLPAAPASGPVRRLYRITFDRPVLVDAEKIADNAFQGSSLIPGAVLKAALARRIELSGVDPQSGDIGQVLAALSISHAVPESDARGRTLCEALPYSLVAAKLAQGIVLGDASGLAPGQGVMLRGEAAYFQPDWKDKWRRDAETALGLPAGSPPPLLARTHTAINDGVARDGQLFTTIARASRRIGKDAEACTWLVTIDRGNCGNEAMAGQLIAALESDLHGIGKTGATAAFELIGEAPIVEPRPVFGSDHRHIVMLTSDAMLVDPIAATSRDGASWAVTAQSVYAAYWSMALPGSSLVNMFTREQWVGAYLSFRRRAYGGESYHPFLVTKAGSTFVIDGADPDRLRHLCRFGLALPTLSHAQTLDWRTCPFVPENGYARIRADHCGDRATAQLLEEVVGV